jgi:hypothetical protein
MDPIVYGETWLALIDFHLLDVTELPDDIVALKAMPTDG